MKAPGRPGGSLEQNAARALSLDDQSVEAHVATARVRLMHDWDWQSARQHALRALQLNSSSAEAHAVYATYLRIAGDLPQDLIHRQRALAVDPYREDMKDELASERYFARDFEGVAAAARQNLATDPNNLGDHVTLCMSLEHLHQLAESFAECRKVLVLQGQSDWGNEYAQQYRQHGYKAANLLVAEKRLDNSGGTTPPRPVGIGKRLRGRGKDRRNLPNLVSMPSRARARFVADPCGPRFRRDPHRSTLRRLGAQDRFPRDGPALCAQSSLKALTDRDVHHSFSTTRLIDRR